ncbi:DUF4148 domain-containing protein [Candidatus Burkholderia verschuerenii]|uniref:DUF4148 domain-containing protein n=1 Tax=Candidatus Burkholderia verschuerenii TaxID=242163 RepID=UPI0009F8A474|nr:DUF4148 domain-containing protein [Candidatus Burkholderia verschuerenii]
MRTVTRLAIVTLIATPTLAIAQSDGPLTRQQVREDLVRAERSGYRPSEHDAQYPASFLDAREGIITSASTPYKLWTGPNLAPNAESYLK